MLGEVECSDLVDFFKVFIPSDWIWTPRVMC